MSNGFYWFPLKGRYFSTAINNALQKAIEERIGRELPTTLTADDINALQQVRDEVLTHAMGGDRACEHLDEIIKTLERCDVKLSRDSGWGY